MTKSLALDLGSFNIYMNSISPGSIDSPVLEGLLETLNVNKAAFDELSLDKAEEIANMTVIIKFRRIDRDQFMIIK